MIKNPYISIIVSTYNSEKFIERKLLDLLQQSIIDKIEIIVVNSGSKQNEESIILNYCKLYNNIHYITTEKRETIYKAWNRAIRIAKGKYITNANTDDLLRRDALEILAENLESHNSVGLVYADQFITSDPDASFRDVKSLKTYYKLDFSPTRLLWRNIVGSQPMWRASIHFNDNIWFDENYEVSGDSEFEFRVSQKYKLRRIPQILGIYYRSASNENKEFQDTELSRSESLLVKEKNARKFLEELNRNTFGRLKLKILLNMIIPRVVYSALRLIIKKYFPTKQIPPKIFWYWFASLYFESRGNLQKAKKYCETYAYANDYLIKRQLERLNNLEV
ncbi:MAG: glycosyltransferase [Ignavibacteriales bacterium]|nr:glycosyltransferase [Ignavibacteriales bacterium]